MVQFPKTLGCNENSPFFLFSKKNMFSVISQKNRKFEKLCVSWKTLICIHNVYCAVVTQGHNYIILNILQDISSIFVKIIIMNKCKIIATKHELTHSKVK